MFSWPVVSQHHTIIPWQAVVNIGQYNSVQAVKPIICSSFIMYYRYYILKFILAFFLNNSIQIVIGTVFGKEVKAWFTINYKSRVLIAYLGELCLFWKQLTVAESNEFSYTQSMVRIHLKVWSSPHFLLFCLQMVWFVSGSKSQVNECTFIETHSVVLY